MQTIQTDNGAGGAEVQGIRFNPNDRRHFIGGSDARIIMGNDEARLLHLWQQKRGEVEPDDLSNNLIVQLGTITEELNRKWYQRHTGHTIKDVQKRVRHPVHNWMAATLDGIVEPTGAVFEAKFMLPWAFTEESAAEKHMAQLQHNMWVMAARSSVLSVITGGGKWVKFMPIRSTSISCSRLKGSFGDAFRTDSRLLYLALKRPAPNWRRSGLWI